MLFTHVRLSRRLLRALLPLTDDVADVRLIPAVEDGTRGQIEGRHGRLRLELVRIDRVLDVHLKDGIADTGCLHSHRTPSIRDLLQSL